jgi:hypothetical protein
VQNLKHHLSRCDDSARARESTPDGISGKDNWKIPCFVPKADAADGELMTIKRAAIALDVVPSTIYRLNNDGIIAGEQIKLGRDLQATG